MNQMASTVQDVARNAADTFKATTMANEEATMVIMWYKRPLKQ